MPKKGLMTFQRFNNPLNFFIFFVDCPHKDHSPACNCGLTYKVPVNYNTRYDPKSMFQTIQEGLSHSLVENELQDSLNSIIRNKRESKSTTTRKIRHKSKNVKKTRKSKKSLKKKRIRSRELSKFNRMPGVQVRRKRLDGDESPCSYTFKSCDVNNRNVKSKSCPLCYKCKCEPSMDKYAKIAVGVPYQEAPAHHEPIVEASRRSETSIRQEFQPAPPSYVGLQPDMYKSYIGQILSK